MASDIGTLIFVEIFRMTNYPGSPFTGNIMQDLIMFLFIPTVFIILFVYILLGMLFPRGWPLRLLTGVAVYLFIVAGGYYGVFARLAGPYFIILIFVLGVLAFVRAHVGVRVEEGGTVPGRRAGHSGGEGLARSAIDVLLRLREREKMLEEAEKVKDQRGIIDAQKEIADLRAELRLLENRMRMNPAEKAKYETLKHMHKVK